MRLLALLLPLAAAPFARADLITINPNRDNTLFEDPTGSLSNGTGALFAGATARNGARRALLSFKVQDFIPANAIITRAELTLWCDRARGSATAFGLHAMDASWGEGSSYTGLGGGVQAERNDATWTTRFYQVGPDWTTPGGDFADLASAVTSVSGTGRAYTWSGAGLVADVQRWLDNPDTNAGWLLKAVDESATGRAKRFASREETIASRRPKLLIEYTLVPAPSSLAVLTATGLAATRRRRA
jgi:hypothetical protein